MIATPADPLLLSVQRSAAVLGVSRATIYRLLDSGTLPSVKVGSRRLIHRQDLEAVAARGASTFGA